MGLSSGALSIPCLQGSRVQFNHFGEEKGNWIIALIVVFAFFRFTQQFFSSPLCNIHPLEDAGEEGEGDSTGGSNESGERCETETCLPNLLQFCYFLVWSILCLRRLSNCTRRAMRGTKIWTRWRTRATQRTTTKVRVATAAALVVPRNPLLKNLVSEHCDFCSFN